MYPYFIILFLLSLLSIADVESRKNILYIYFSFFIAMVLFLFAGLREAGVGDDDFEYIKRFQYIPDFLKWVLGEYDYTISDTQVEFGYFLLNSFIKYFTFDYSWLFLCVAFISVGIALYNYYYYSPYFFLSTLLFFSHTYLYRDLNQIRSAIAAAIGLFLIKQIDNKEHIRVLLTIALASLFHAAALIFLLVYLASFIKIGKKNIILILIAGGGVGFLGVKAFIMFMPQLGYITTKIINYSQSQYAETVSLFDFTNIKNIAIVLCSVLLWDKLVNSVKYYRTVALFMVLATSWRLAFSDLGIIAARVATFLGIVEVILIPMFVLAFKNKWVIKIVIVTYAALVFYLNVSIKDVVSPYSSVLNLF